MLWHLLARTMSHGLAVAVEAVVFVSEHFQQGGNSGVYRRPSHDMQWDTCQLPASIVHMTEYLQRHRLVTQQGRVQRLERGQLLLLQGAHMVLVNHAAEEGVVPTLSAVNAAHIDISTQHDTIANAESNHQRHASPIVDKM